jgi:hypothetical protein
LWFGEGSRSGLKPPTYGDLVNEGSMSGLAEPNVVNFLS